jgi:hypothetical protein
MTIALFNPYGSRSPESGFLVVLARYLNERGFSLTALRCSGILTACDRLDSLKKSSVLTCLDCVREHDKNMGWADIPSTDLSPYFRSNDFLSLSHQVEKVSIARSLALNIEGVSVHEVVSEEVLSQLAPARQATVLLEASRLIKAFSCLLRERHFDGIFLPHGKDVYLKSLTAVAVKKGVRLFQLRWLPERHVVEINGSGESRNFYSELVFDHIDSLRSEVSSWPKEIRQRLGLVEEYLGITQQQLSLPIV